MTPTIFGSTVGYPSDSLASCILRSAMADCDTVVNPARRQKIYLFFSSKIYTDALQNNHLPVAFITGCVVVQHCCNDDQQSQWKNGEIEPL